MIVSVITLTVLQQLSDADKCYWCMIQAHAGVALLNAIPPTAQGETLPSSESSTKTLTPSTSSTASTSPGSYNMFYDPISELQFSEIIRLYCAICDTYFGRKL